MAQTQLLSGPVPAAGMTLAASAARNANGVTDDYFDMSGLDDALLVVNVTAVAGTPTLKLRSEVSHDGTLWWPQVIALANTAFDTLFLQTTGASAASFTTAVPLRMYLGAASTMPFLKWYRLRWDISGTTPSFTFSAILLPLTNP